MAQALHTLLTAGGSAGSVQVDVLYDDVTLGIYGAWAYNRSSVPFWLGAAYFGQAVVDATVPPETSQYIELPPGLAFGPDLGDPPGLSSSMRWPA